MLESSVNPTLEYPRWHDVVAGAVAGFASRLITAPLDLIKIRLQLSSPDATSGGLGIISTLSKIVRTEGGIRSLFRGNLSATYLWIGYAAVQFSMYSRTSDLLTRFSQTTSNTCGNFNLWNIPTIPFHAISSNPTAVAFISGATAGVSATMATYPFDICRTAFASSRVHSLSAATAATKSNIPPIPRIGNPPTSIGQFFSTIYKVHGVRGLFAGASPAVVQIVPYMGINFALYDYFCRVSDRTNVGNAALAGAFAGGISKFIVYPMDTVKKRIQANTFNVFGNNVEGKAYANMLDCSVRMAKEEGLHAFYRGLAPTVIKSMVATSVTFASFTVTKNALRALHDRTKKNK